MNFNQYSFVSSNEDKLREFQSFGLIDLDIKKGRDIKEVDSNGQNVTIYKSLEAGPMTLVEDTSLIVQGTDIGTNIKFQLNLLGNCVGKRAQFIVYLAVNDGEYISIFMGKTCGQITAPVPLDSNEHVVGFDNHFTPDGSSLNLHELSRLGRRNDYSARKRAVGELLEEVPLWKRPITEIPKWLGKFQ